MAKMNDIRKCCKPDSNLICPHEHYGSMCQHTGPKLQQSKCVILFNFCKKKLKKETEVHSVLEMHWSEHMETLLKPNKVNFAKYFA